MVDMGKVAYEAYAAHQAWRNWAGSPLLPWDAVRHDVQDAWRAAADAVYWAVAPLLRPWPPPERH